MKRIVVGNTNQCSFYDYKRPNTLNLIKAIECPENKLKDSELVSDRPGHYKTMSSTRGSYEQETDPEKNKIDNFAKKLADILNHARNNHEYKELIVVMPAQMEGMLSQHLNKEVKKLIINRLEKNVVHLSPQQLLHYLNENL